MASLSPLLHNFSAEDVIQLSSFGESRSYAPGDTIIEEGAENQHLYLVLKGKIEVVKTSELGDTRIAEIGTSGSIGEMSVFDPGPASATVRAIGDVEVWRITSASLEQLNETRPKVAYRLVSRICACLSQRLRHLNERFVDV